LRDIIPENGISLLLVDLSPVVVPVNKLELPTLGITSKEVKIPSIDVVSKVDLKALDNVIENVNRESSTRFDYKNVKYEITFDRNKCHASVMIVPSRE